ncbi:hypothetical protein MU0083_002096 [[Mycobacterium] kokjensenii]|uniref:Uncharacterized protein n=1 Tax=[Mycobacterium] kokjensenii TaxID=3064287 RepID=A0ABM9LHM2_9MYCO|nr:hypothetical protein [Mycolicibacter sp. MU0083]CAJ1499107.1 hypothetical protein MU0083_002096 [Mycolicibacter sp. MU0083]
MGQRRDSWDNATIGLLFLVVSAVLGGIGAVIAKVGGAFVVAIGQFWIPLLIMAALAGVVAGVEYFQRQRQAAVEAEEQRQRTAAALARRTAEKQTAREKAEAQERAAARKRVEDRKREAARKEAEERERRAIERRKADRKARIAEIGESAVKLIERADAAAARVCATEAARLGWLGDPDDLDFTPDLAMITASVEAGAQLRRLADELKAIPDHTDEDRTRLADAKRSAEALWRKANARAKLLEECANRARLIDESLEQERQRALIAERRDDVISRLDAALYGVAATPDSPPSDSADKVLAMVAAYQEIKGSLEVDRSQKPDEDAAEPTDDSSSWGVLTPLNRAWHWAFG